MVVPGAEGRERKKEVEKLNPFVQAARMPEPTNGGYTCLSVPSLLGHQFLNMPQASWHMRQLQIRMSMMQQQQPVQPMPPPLSDKEPQGTGVNLDPEFQQTIINFGAATDVAWGMNEGGSVDAVSLNGEAAEKERDTEAHTQVRRDDFTQLDGLKRVPERSQQHRKTARKARVAKRGLQVVEAAEIEAEEWRLEQVAAERKTAKARRRGLPSRVQKRSRTVTLAPASDFALLLGDQRVGQVGGSWGAASVRNLECELREEAKARRAAAERPFPVQASGSSTVADRRQWPLGRARMWARKIVANFGDMLGGISCWLDGAVRAMVTHVAGTTPSEPLSAREEVAGTTPSEPLSAREEVAGTTPSEPLSAREKARSCHRPAVQVGGSMRRSSARRLQKLASKARKQAQETLSAGRALAGRAPASDNLCDTATAAGHTAQEEGGAPIRHTDVMSEDVMDGSRGLAGRTQKAWKGQLFVRGCGGKTQVLSNVDSDDTVGVIRSRLRGHHPLAQRMMWAGKSLEDHRTLASYGICKESTLTLLWRLRGGTKPEVNPDLMHASAAAGAREPQPRQDLRAAEQLEASKMRLRTDFSRHPDVPACQRESCILAACRDQTIPNISNDWPIEDLLDVFVSHRNDFNTLTRVCISIATKKPDPDTACRLGVIDQIVAAMKHHHTIPSLQMWACTALGSCSRRSETGEAKVAEVGGIKCVLEAMKAFPEHADVQLAACQLLMSLATKVELRGLIMGSGGEKLVRHAMEASNADPLVKDPKSGLGKTLLDLISSREVKGMVEEKHSKLCMDPNSLVRKGKFGGIELFDSTLDEHIGFMDSRPLRAMYAEHVMAPGSQEPFSPPNNPDLVCTPEGEFNFVVGEDGVDTEKWELKPGARPTCAEESMVAGRNNKALEDLLKMPQVKAAGLLDVEVVALRLYSGPLYSKYNRILRETLSSESQDAVASADANNFATTIHLIVSGICKLGRVAAMPEGRVVYRGLSGLALPPEFFEKDRQGFAGAVEASFMSTTTSQEVARKYSGVREGRVATIFKLLLGKTSLGADISWLSQFEGEAEMVFPPRTHLQILEQVEGSDGVSVITLKPTTFQNVSTVEEVVARRKEGMKSLASSLTWDLRNEAVRDGRFDKELARRLDALEVKLINEYSRQAPEWYNDNAKYKGNMRSLFKDVKTAREQIHDSSSVLCKSLEAAAAAEAASAAAAAQGPGSARAADAEVRGNLRGAAGAAPVASSQVAALHSKFCLNPRWKGVKARFASDDMYARGIEAVIGPMDAQYIRAMFNEHNTMSDSGTYFQAWNAGNDIKTTPQREWEFVVGPEGVVKSGSGAYEIDVSKSEPRVCDGMMVDGRNQKRLADLLQTPVVKEAGLSAAEIVAVRLYSGPMYVKYNGVMRGMASGGTTYSATIHVKCSALMKLSRVAPPPRGLVVYRGNGGMALPEDFFEEDAQGCAGAGEPALMSTTPIREVALGYAGVASGKDLPTLFEIEVGKTCIGADISAISQFGGEGEILYTPLAMLEIIGKPRIDCSSGRELSVLRMSLTVNQKTKTVEQAVRSRRDFLEQLATSRIWDFRHWAKSSDTAERLDGLIQELARAVHEKVATAELQVLNSNVGFEEVFDSIFAEADTAGEKVAEALWQDGLTAQAAPGQEQEALMLMRKAVDARLDKVLCRVEEAGTRRAIEMRTHLVNMQDREGMDRDQQAAFASDNSKLASLLDDVGNFEQALVHYGKAQEVFVAVYGDNSLDVAATYNNQGNVYEKLARFDDALEAYSKSLDIKIKVVGQDHLEVAKTYCNMANVYQMQGLFERALEFYQKDLDITVNILGQDCLDVAQTYNNQAIVYGKLGRYDDALEAFSKSLDVKIKVVGHDSPSVADTHVNIGVVHYDLADYEQALFHYGKAEEVYLAVYGRDHLDVAKTYNNQGNVYQKLSRFDDALEAYSKSRDIMIKVVGQDHLDVAKSQENIAIVYRKQGKFEEALEMFSAVLETKTRVVGHGHPLVADTLQNIGVVHQNQGRATDAREFFSKAYHIRLDKLGPNHPHTTMLKRFA